MPSPQRESPVERPRHPLQRPTTYEYTSMKNLNATKSGFWGVLAKKAKNIFEEEDGVRKFEAFDRASPRAAELSRPSSSQLHQSTDIPDTVRTEKLKIQKGLGAIASSLDYIGGKFGNALEEGFTIVETKAADIISDTRKINMRRKVNTSTTVGQTQQSIHSDIKAVNMPAIKTLVTCTDFETQLKASRDVAMTMAAKTKLLLRELKTVKANLSFAKQRCTQLEEENKILRESTAKGDSPEDDDLIRLQLETLLAEKARLAHENSVYARENRFLREVVEYHQLTMQDVVYLDEGVEEVKEVYPIHIPFERQPDSNSNLSPGRSPLPSPLPSPCVPHTSSALSSNPET